MYFYVDALLFPTFSSVHSNEFDQSKDMRLQKLIRFKIERNFFSFFAKIIEGSRIRVIRHDEPSSFVNHA